MNREQLELRMQEVCTELLRLQDREDCERRRVRSEHASHLAKLRRARSMHANHAVRPLRAQDGRHQSRGRINVPAALLEKRDLQARELVTLVLSNSEHATSSTVTVSLPDRHRHTGRRPLPTNVNTDAGKDDGSYTSVPEQVWPNASPSTIQSASSTDPPAASTPKTASVTKNTQATISKTSASASHATKFSKQASPVSDPAASRSKSKTTEPAKDEGKTPNDKSTPKPATRTRSSHTSASFTKPASPSPSRPVRIVTVCGPEGAHTKDAGGQQRRYNWTTRTVYDAACTPEASATPSSSFSPHVTSSANSPIANFPNEPLDVPEADGRDDPQAFFATPGGKGAIAGITVGSVALTLLVLAALFWRRSKKRDSDVRGVATARRRSAMSTSSFGDDSGDAGSFMDVSGPHPLGSHSHYSHTMGEVRTSLRDEPSFVVESRRKSTAWTTMDPSQMPITSTVGAETAAAGLRPPFHRHQQSTGPEGSDGADDGGDPSSLERIPSSSSHEDEHNPFDDPTMPEAAQLSAQVAVPLAAGASTRGGVERRKSAGFTSDTYRSGRRKSRLLSVRNPDVHPEPAEAYEGPTFDHYPSEQDEQEALTPTLLDKRAPPRDITGVSALQATGQSTSSESQPKLVNAVAYRQSHAPTPSPDLSLRSPLTNLADGLEAEASNPDHEGSWKSWKNPLSYSSPHANPLSGYFPDVRLGSVAGDQGALPPVSNLIPKRPPMNSAISTVSQLRSSRPGTAGPSAQQQCHGQPRPVTRQSRTSTNSNSTTRSSFSMYPFGGYHRSWVNDGVQTPVEIQDVQLGGSTVGTGNGLTGSFLGNPPALAGIGYFR